MAKCNPSLLEKDTIIYRDSIRVIDTVIIESSTIDTSFFSSSDTIIIENERIKIKYIRRDSIITITGESKGDTVFVDKKIYIEKKIPVEKLVVREPTLAEEFGTFGKNLLFLIIAIGLGYLIFRIIKKRLL